jgi:S-adenosylmethionine decarboxylase
MPLPGRQIVLDLYNCDYDRLLSQEQLAGELQDVMASYQLTVLSCQTNTRGGEGLSIVALHQHGHIIIHTLPALGFASVDAFSCIDDAGINKLAFKIKRFFQAEKTKSTYLKRGDFGSLNDMKPIVRKQVKAWRRVRNTSAKVLRIFVNKKPTVD